MEYDLIVGEILYRERQNTKDVLFNFDETLNQLRNRFDP
jgi:hypothetical protein